MIHLLSNVRIPHCYFELRQSPIKVLLHGFCDASDVAYAAVVYVQSTYADGHVITRLVVSKTRVLSLKKQTIPYLELMVALILARLVSTVVPLITNLQEVHCWTDSITVLHWIQNNHVWRQYVQHQVDEIRQLTNPNSWKHSPGYLNPADLPSRGVKIKELIDEQTWWEGPNFLSLPVEEWPMSLLGRISERAAAEMLRNLLKVIHSSTTN